MSFLIKTFNTRLVVRCYILIVILIVATHLLLVSVSTINSFGELLNDFNNSKIYSSNFERSIPMRFSIAKNMDIFGNHFISKKGKY